MNVPFFKKILLTDSRKSRYASLTVLLESFYFADKLVLFSARVFLKKSFSKLEIRTLTPSRFKNQSNDTLKLLERYSNHQQGFVKQKMLFSIMLNNRAAVDT